MSDDYGNASARGRSPDVDEATLRERLRADDPRERRDAALGVVDRAGAADAPADAVDAPTVRALADRVTADPDPDVRQFAVEALGLAGAADGVAPALSDDDPWVRAEAVVAYSRAAGGDAADRLRDRLADDAGPVRRNALIALAKLDAVDPDRLRDRLKHDPHGPVREYAAEWLGERPGDVETTVRVLAAVLARDGEAFVRANAAGSLGNLGTDRAIEALETQGVGDRSNDVQRAAKRALATARGDDPDDLDLGDPPAPGGGPDAPGEGPASGTHRSATEASHASGPGGTGGTGGPGETRGGGDGPIGRQSRSPPSTATRRRDGGERR